MRCMRIGAALLLVASGAFAGGIVWEKDFDSARAKSAREGKLLYLDFWSPG